ncbi:hypothetical protein, partial [Mesorhizobium sp. M7A.F.Ca.US.006.01.2.1]|uniref:hypothetical protein n=1 Tax=Mesorhizobium sp. M7A.F.Ca.US.006.01.2.1 TaxID=2496708 RepID=UPI0019D1BEE3
MAEFLDELFHDVPSKSLTPQRGHRVAVPESTARCGKDAAAFEYASAKGRLMEPILKASGRFGFGHVGAELR